MTMDDDADMTVKREGGISSEDSGRYAGIPAKRPLPTGEEGMAPSGSGTKAYLAHTASHLSSSQANSSRSPSPSSSSPSSRHTPALASNSGAVASTSKHKLPPHYRGPLPREDDPEDVAPLPLLHVAPGYSSSSSSSRLYQPPNTPLNRNSWRYTFAGPSTSYLPTSVYRSIPSQPDRLRWDWSDRSAFTKLSREADVVSSDKGWRSVRCNVPVREGSWYVEIEVLADEHGSAAVNGKDGPHVRLGWGRREASLNAPVGFDGYSYALRDTTGQCITLSRPQPYGSPFRPGDVIGMYIHIPSPLPQPSPKDPRDPRHVRKRRIPIRYRGQTYFEQLEYAQSKEMEHLMDRSWAGDRILGQDGRLRLAQAANAGPNGGLDPMSELVEEGEHREGAVRPGGKRNGTTASSSFSSAPSQSTAPPGTGKSKRQAGPGDEPGGGGGKSSKNKGPPGGKVKVTRQLRPLPTLGPESRIGFYINGVPQGWAFQDLLDYRPLRPHPTAEDANLASTGKKRGPKPLGQDGSADSFVQTVIRAARLAGRDSPFYPVHDVSLMECELASVGISSLDDIPLLTASASLSAIMKSRENAHDDGSCGYWVMGSVYGGARLRLRGEGEEGDGLRYRPGGKEGFSGVERELEAADRRRRRRQAREQDAQATSEMTDATMPVEEDADIDAASIPAEPWWGRCRPLSERYAEYWAEQWNQDLAEEERARVRAKYIKPVDLEDDQEDEDEVGDDGRNAAGAFVQEEGMPPVKGGAGGRKKGGRPSAANTARRSNTPRQGTPGTANASRRVSPFPLGKSKLDSSSPAPSSRSSPVPPTTSHQHSAGPTGPHALSSEMETDDSLGPPGTTPVSGSSQTQYDTPPLAHRSAAAAAPPAAAATAPNFLDSLAEAALMQKAVEEADAEHQRRRRSEGQRYGDGMAEEDGDGYEQGADDHDGEQGERGDMDVD